MPQHVVEQLVGQLFTLVVGEAHVLFEQEAAELGDDVALDLLFGEAAVVEPAAHPLDERFLGLGLELLEVGGKDGDGERCGQQVFAVPARRGIGVGDRLDRRADVGCRILCGERWRGWRRWGAAGDGLGRWGRELGHRGGGLGHRGLGGW